MAICGRLEVPPQSSIARDERVQQFRAERVAVNFVSACENSAINGSSRKTSARVSAYPAPAGASPLYSANFNESGSRNASSREAVLARPYPTGRRARRSSSGRRWSCANRPASCQSSGDHALAQIGNRFGYDANALLVFRRKEKRAEERTMHAVAKSELDCAQPREKLAGEIRAFPSRLQQACPSIRLDSAPLL